MASMFENATSATSDVSTWDVSNVKKLLYIFAGVNQHWKPELSKWDVSQAGDTTTIFGDPNAGKIVESGDQQPGAQQMLQQQLFGASCKQGQSRPHPGSACKKCDPQFYSNNGSSCVACLGGFAEEGSSFCYPCALNT